MGELDAAIRLTSLFTGVPVGGVPKYISLVDVGERA
jgi:hypothetical protein